MLTLGPLAFTAPWMLLGLAALPALWLLLRLLPPSPRAIRFPAIRLLFGLRGEETTPRAAPWWLVVMRLAIAACVILGAARPVLDPERALTGDGPILVAIDNGWAAAPQWADRLERADDILGIAARSDRPVYLMLSAPETRAAAFDPIRLLPASEAREIVAALTPRPWLSDRARAAGAVSEIAETGITADVFWFSDGVAAEGSDRLAEAFARLGPTTVMTPDPGLGPVLLIPPRPDDAALAATARRLTDQGDQDVALVGFAEDGRPLLRRDARFADGETDATFTLDLPVDLRNQVSLLTIEDRVGAGSTVLLDERWRRRAMGILADIGSREALPLLSETYFLSRALQPLGTVDRGPASVLLRVPQSVLLLPDETVLESEDTARLTSWIEEGGMLVRFAGPRLAAATDDPLTPVALRGGGRQLSGAMLWTEPARIGRISEDGPFVGIDIPEDIEVIRQVLAEPSLDLDEKTWMRLEDDTPLVTADRLGDGWLVLVHTTANTEWSNLALSGLFVDMLERLSTLGRGVRDAAEESGLAPPYRTLNGFGALVDPQNSARPIDVSALAEVAPAPESPPGFYGSQSVRVAVNLGDRVSGFAPLSDLPEGVVETGFAKAAEKPLTPFLLLAALFLLVLDTVVTVALRGYGVLKPAWGVTAATVLLATAVVFQAAPASAQQRSEGAIPAAARATTLAYVLTGDPDIDRVSEAGMVGLSEVLRQRTAVEAGPPDGVNIDRDELAFYPLLYWPIVEDAAPLSASTADRINRFMATGGMILFDTRDGHLASGQLGPVSGTLRDLTRRLNIPPVAAVPPEHVLTRSFYLLAEFPGRWSGGSVWVETGVSTTNDGVSPVIVGDADWAAAWAVDESGRPMFPISGDGERQREMAYRFGVNLVMYTLTGNYKSDQVHIPSILERLGQ
jgi:hypothetical protein